MSDEDWEDLDVRIMNAIHMCLAQMIFASVLRISKTKDLQGKLREIYQAKHVTNRVYLKKQFHILNMKECKKISDHLSILNSIVSKLKAIGVKIDGEDKAS